ncbi:hypothetical protein [Companilactobacillus furfuricola]|uniref:hypothetical protein n=1 Tax=Companilactobacillus furfuricola TaxID=1462575 RepID=UPI000F76DBC3|nr:hypothetical protein [Companilactobacillus furfuricola]
MNNKSFLKVCLIYFFVPIIIVGFIFGMNFNNQQTTGADLEKAMPIIVKRDQPWDAGASKNDSNSEVLGPKSQNQVEALKNAPDGLDIAPLFKLGTFGSPKDNSAVIKDNTNRTGIKSSILKVNDSQWQLGSIWSDINSGNYIDVSKDQTLSMWLYFGNQELLRGSGDGMAFVLQNDSKGISAISQSQQNQGQTRFGNGESIGVWGTDFDGNQTDPNQIAKTAIQNSFALEFDSFGDITTDGSHPNNQGVGFDSQNEIANSNYDSTQHIAMAYPDSPNTYTPERGTYGNYFVMKHSSLQSGVFLPDGYWHHLTLKWNKGDGKIGRLTYEYNDKKRDGTPNTYTNLNENSNGYIDSNSYLSSTQAVDISHFKLPKEGPMANKLRWGFTGSTGENYQDNLISFETVPSAVNADISSSLFDETRQFEITNDQKTQQNKVHTGDDLTFKYHLAYLSGEKDWVNIYSKVDVPDGVKFVSADITYADGSTEQVTDPQIDDHQLTCKITRPLNQSMKNATLNVHSQAGTQELTVKPSHARFKSQYDILDTQTPQFQIVTSKLNLRTDPFGTINYKDKNSIPSSLKINCYVWEKELSDNDNANVQLFYKLGNIKNSIQLNSLSSKIPYILKIDKQDLNYGSNLLEIYAKDKQDDFQTPVHKITINIADSLYFENNTPTVNFQTVISDYPGQLISRVGDWDFRVSDARSKGNGWKLAVKASPNQKEYKHFDGSIIYKNRSGQESSLINPQIIDIKQKDNDSKQETNIVKNWSKKSGILLKSNGQNNPGRYSFQLDWYLIDGI